MFPKQFQLRHVETFHSQATTIVNSVLSEILNKILTRTKGRYLYPAASSNKMLYRIIYITLNKFDVLRRCYNEHY